MGIMEKEMDTTIMGCMYIRFRIQGLWHRGHKLQMECMYSPGYVVGCRRSIAGFGHFHILCAAAGFYIYIYIYEYW